MNKYDEVRRRIESTKDNGALHHVRTIAAIYHGTGELSESDMISLRSLFAARQDELETINWPNEEGPENVLTEHDPVNKPAHYRSHPSGIECIQVTEWMSFTLGNAVKYIWRADLKNDAIEDLKKAVWYITRELEKREKAAEQ